MCRIYYTSSEESLPSTYVRLCTATKEKGKRFEFQPQSVVTERGTVADRPIPLLEAMIEGRCCARSRSRVLEQYQEMTWI